MIYILCMSYTERGNQDAQFQCWWWGVSPWYGNTRGFIQITNHIRSTIPICGFAPGYNWVLSMLILAHKCAHSITCHKKSSEDPVTGTYPNQVIDQIVILFLDLSAHSW